MIKEDLVEVKPVLTKDVSDCGNTGCLFNENNLCTSTTGACYGYVGELKTEKTIGVWEEL